MDKDYKNSLSEFKIRTLDRLRKDGLYPHLEDLGFFDAPASVKYHGAYKGGLFDHSAAVAMELEFMTSHIGLNWNNPRSPYIVGILHDLCKVDQYRYNSRLSQWEYSNDSLLSGHGDKSVIIAQKYLTLTDEETACIRWHMGAFETDTKLWDFYGRAVCRFPNVLYTHTADMLASKVRGY